MFSLLLLLTLGSSAAASGEDAGLDQKLSRQFERYESARTSLFSGVREGAGRMGRGQWEVLLVLPAEDEFSPEDLDALRARQEGAIESSRLLARAESLLSLDAVRAAGEAAAFCGDMPKGGMLHVHPNGTLDPATVKLLLERVNPVINTQDLLDRVRDAPMDIAQEMLAFLEPYGGVIRYAKLSKEDQVRLQALFLWPPGTKVPQIAFGLVSSMSKHASHMETVLRAFFKRAQEHKISYLEMAKSLKPGFGTDLAMGLIDDLAKEYEIEARFNVGLNRSNGEKKNFRKAQRWIAADRQSMVVGIDLYGRESVRSTLDAGQRIYAAVLDAQARGTTELHTTIHAAGLGESRNPRDAVVMGIERIGHGVGLRADPVALEYARSQRTAIETNLTSNLRLGYVESLAVHPFVDFLRLGLPVSLSTDNEGMLETDISNECAIAVASFDLEYAELRKMMVNSIETSFASAKLKKRLAKKLEKDLGAFEQRWSRFAAR